jgi:predicted negative regulator of RcsB-dependent stress response
MAVRAIDAMRDVAEQPLVDSNSGEDIERVRQKSRDALRDAKTDEAVAILDRQLEAEHEAMEDRRRRAIVLLKDKVDVERLRYDHAAVRKTLQDIIQFDPDAVWRGVGLGGEWITVGSLLDATDAFQGALSAARRTGDAGNEATALEDLSDVLVAQGNLDEALKSFHDSLAIQGPPRQVRPRQCRLAARSRGVLQQGR